MESHNHSVDCPIESTRRRLPCPWLALCLAIAACATPIKEPEPSGFLTDYSSLQAVSENHLQALNPALAHYHQFVIERPIVLYKPDEGGDEFSADELDELKDHIVGQFASRLGKDEVYQVVDEPGPDIARLRFVITDLDATDGLLNISFITKATGAGLGGIAMEMEASDSISGEQLLGAVRWGTGSRVLRAGITRLGDAKIQTSRWARDFRQLLDELAEKG